LSYTNCPEKYNHTKAQNFLGQKYEAKLSLLILNKMMAIGMPQTIRIA